jgi:uncharacterized protein
MDTFEKLREQLALQEWPSVYLFKFIVENTKEKLAQTTALFDSTADITFHTSSNKKYVSVSAKELMMDVDSILAKYEKAALIEGIISL